MNRLCLVSDSSFDVEALHRQLAGLLEVCSVKLAQVLDATPARFNLIAAGLNDPSRLLDLKEWIKSRPKDGRVIFVTHAGSHIERTQAFALGATDVIHRPVDAKALLRVISSEFAALGGEMSQWRAPDCRGVAAAHDGLQAVFSAACLGEPFNAKSITAAGEAVVNEIESKGLSSWIDTVRRHHSQTYQHCLLVTGTAVAFGQHIGLSQPDRTRLSMAGMLHDVGKARIPVAILEKPASLDDDETAIMRKHPEYGLEALKSARGLQPEMLDMVVHHHEYLDGSGYPHGLQASEISDLVRMMTIADIFGALIEQRAYKPPLSGQKAYEMLLDMGPRLDRDLVRAFRAVTLAAP